MINEIVASNIRAERARANMSVKEVCEALDISRPTYDLYEKNASNCTTSTYIQLAKLFGCDMDVFFKINTLQNDK